jgi:hypothetical protein
MHEYNGSWRDWCGRDGLVTVNWIDILTSGYMQVDWMNNWMDWFLDRWIYGCRNDEELCG